MENEKEILIDHFLSHSLGSADRKKFEKMIKEDPLFSKEVLKAQHAHHLLRIDYSANVFKKIVDESKGTSRERKIKIIKFSNYKRILSWAAVIAVIVSIAVFYCWMQTKSNNSEKIMAEEFKSYSLMEPSVLSETDNSPLGYKQQAYKAYENEDYEKAITLFEKISEKDAYMNFYLGNAQLALHNDKEAIESFLHIIESNKDFALMAQTKWYLALGYLEEGKKDQAHELLIGLLTDPMYHDKAAGVLRKMKN